MQASVLHKYNNMQKINKNINNNINKKSFKIYQRYFLGLILVITLSVTGFYIYNNHIILSDDIPTNSN